MGPILRSWRHCIGWTMAAGRALPEFGSFCCRPLKPLLAATLLFIVLHCSHALSFTSIELDCNGVGCNVDVVLSFTPSISVSNGGSITLNMPNGYLSYGYNFALTSNISSLYGQFSAARSQEIVFYIYGTQSGTGIGGVVMTMSGFQLGPTRNTISSGFTLATYEEPSASNALDALAIIAAPVFNMIAISSNGAGSPVQVMMIFFPGVSVPIGGRITLAMPSGYFRGTASLAAGASSIPLMTGSAQPVDQSSTALVLTVAGADTGITAGLTLTLSGLTLGAAQPAGSFKLSTSAEIGNQKKLAEQIYDSVAFTSISIRTEELGYGEGMPVTLVMVFSPGVSVPIGGRITLAIPSGYFRGTASLVAGASSVPLMTGSAQPVDQSSTALVLTVAGADTGITAGLTLTLSGLTLGAAQPAGSFKLSTSLQVGSFQKVAPAIFVGSWKLSQNINPFWISNEAPNVPSSSALPLIIDVSARFLGVSGTFSYYPYLTNDLTFAAGESIMIPVCNPGSSNTNSDSSQDSKITFDSNSRFSFSILNGTTGSLIPVIPLSETNSLKDKVYILNGYLRIIFPMNVYAVGCMIVISLTQMKVAPGTTCKSASSMSVLGTRAGKSSFDQYSLYVSSLLGPESRVSLPNVMTAAFSDSRPSRPTSIRIRSPNSLLRGEIYCSQSDIIVTIQLPLYFGTQLNTSSISVTAFASPQDSSGNGGYTKAMFMKITKLTFDPATCMLSGSIAPSTVVSSCQQSSASGDIYIDITGLSTPRFPAYPNLQLSFSLLNLYAQLVFPAIETISKAKITFTNYVSAGIGNFLVSFVTSSDVMNICGPGNDASKKQRIILHVKNASHFCDNRPELAATFLSIPKNSLARVGLVSMRSVGDSCEVSLYLSSGDLSYAGCSPVVLPTPLSTLLPVEILISGVKISQSLQPPLPVSIDIDEGSPNGVTQSCIDCAEWPSTPVFSCIIELPIWARVQSYQYNDRFSTIIATLIDIGEIIAGDFLSIQIPNGVSFVISSQSTSASPLICTGSTLYDTSSDKPKFDVKSYYPNLILQWKIGNGNLSFGTLNVTCSWSIDSSGSSAYWISSFDSHPTNDLKITKTSSSGFRQIRTGYSPGRYFSSAIVTSLVDQRPGLSTVFTISASRGSFRSSVLIPALGYSLIYPSSGGTAVATCSCVPGGIGGQSSTTMACDFNGQGGRTILADVEISGDFLKISGFLNARYNRCNMTVRNPDLVGPQGSAIAFIDDIADRLYSAPSIYGISTISITLSTYHLSSLTQATITFAHSSPLSVNSEIRITGFCNFVQQSLSVSFVSSAVQATVTLNGCNMVIVINSGILEPPPSGSIVRCVISNLKTPVVRQARSVVSMSTHSGSISVVPIDFCSECAYVSEMPPFRTDLSLSSITPGSSLTEISLSLQNVWTPFVSGTVILLAIPNPKSSTEAFPGGWSGPSSSFKILINGDQCEATVELSSSGLKITYLGSITYTSLDMTISLGPFYTVPRKLMKSYPIQVTKSSTGLSFDSVSAVANYPDILGNCRAGYSLNTTSLVCERCNMFRYNDGTMTECKICSGQLIGDSATKATKCVPFCTWPFEYMYDEFNSYNNRCEKDSGTCTIFASETEDAECQCNNDPYYYQYGVTYSSYISNCKIVNLNSNNNAIATVFIVFLVFFFLCILRLPSKKDSTIKQRVRLKANLIFLAFFPTLDFLSDLVYILTSKFNNIIIFAAAAFFFLFPMFMFMRQLMKHRAYIHFYLVRVPKVLQLREYDNIPKLIYGFLVHLPFYILNLPTIVPLFLAGHFLYCAKLIPLSNVSNIWLRLYTGRRDHDSRSSIIVHLLQESIFEEIVTESLPQLAIQAINQTLNKEWTTLGYISIVMSSMMALNGVYRFLYFYVMKKIPIKDVPSGLEDDVFDLEGVELGKYALQLPPPSETKVAPLSDSKHDTQKGSVIPHHSVDLSSIELQPLIQKIDAVQNENLSTSKRIDAMDFKFDGIDSRLDGIDVKLNGILEALSQASK